MIYLLECQLCKVQFVGNSEAPFHIRLNKHRKDVKHLNPIEACKHLAAGTTSSISMENSC